MTGSVLWVLIMELVNSKMGLVKPGIWRFSDFKGLIWVDITNFCPLGTGAPGLRGKQPGVCYHKTKEEKAFLKSELYKQDCREC